MRTKKIDDFLSKGQLNSMNKGKAFQMKYHQFMEPTNKTNHHVKLQVGHSHFKKLINIWQLEKVFV